MSGLSPTTRRFTARRPPARALRPLLAALGYVAAVAILLWLAFGTIADLMERRAAVADATALLDRLQGRGPMPSSTPGAAPGPQRGSAFLDGPSLTIAGADLLQRLSSAVSAHGGRLTSSRVEVQGTPYGAGFVAVSATLDMAQPDLQKLLYDLEAGMPFLFVGQLVVQASGTSPEGRTEAPADERMRVTLTVYGQWQGAR
ncbi:type II secretion system protein M [Xanthobacter dioxanivorans]|uniref:Type II secretion system protein M n=1 Tax=Xanthobacter dioxanivorans TaxID=2528964 RepID=A0A974SJ56_9HYPH|nr:type II secretion system protein GspM [Xanthobacter dioxanivorans]QRG06038.1 type II secretion system protein M [Xanthobacter dioxanivorans]